MELMELMELVELVERKEWMQEIPIDGTTGSLAVRRLSFHERGRYGKLRHYPTFHSCTRSRQNAAPLASDRSTLDGTPLPSVETSSILKA